MRLRVILINIASIKSGEISIPSGAIKRFKPKFRKSNLDLISIPSGAIKSLERCSSD